MRKIFTLFLVFYSLLVGAQVSTKGGQVRTTSVSRGVSREDTVSGIGASVGYVLTWQGFGNLPIWAAAVGGSPAGPSYAVQYNNGGSFGGNHNILELPYTNLFLVHPIWELQLDTAYITGKNGVGSFIWMNDNSIGSGKGGLGLYFGNDFTQYIVGDSATGSIYIKVNDSVDVNTPKVNFHGSKFGVNGVPYTWPATQGAASTFLEDNGSGGLLWSSAVTSFSSGNLSPLFTTSVATATTTPALSFSLNTQNAYTIFGNNVGGLAPPTFFSPTLASPLFRNQGTTTTVLHGNAAGNPSWSAVSLANDITGTLTVGNGGSGATTFTAYAVLCAGTTSTGAFQNVSGVGTSGQVLTSNGASALPTWQSRTATFGATFDGQTAVVTVGAVTYFTIPFNGTITGWQITADQTSPTCTIDIWKIASGSALPTVSNSIVGGNYPALSSGNVVESTNITSWSTGITSGDIVAVYVSAVTVATKISIQITYTKP